MFEQNKKYSEYDKQYNLNSFRGQCGDKAKQKDSRLVSPKEIILSTDKFEDKSQMKNKPRLLTARLPPAFNMKSKGHFGEENLSPKKIIGDKHPEIVIDDNELTTPKKLNSYINYVN
jgi:hypothetical protein